MPISSEINEDTVVLDRKIYVLSQKSELKKYFPIVQTALYLLNITYVIMSKISITYY